MQGAKSPSFVVIHTMKMPFSCPRMTYDAGSCCGNVLVRQA